MSNVGKKKESNVGQLQAPLPTNKNEIPINENSNITRKMDTIIILNNKLSRLVSTFPATYSKTLSQYRDIEK